MSYRLKLKVFLPFFVIGLVLLGVWIMIPYSFWERPPFDIAGADKWNVLFLYLGIGAILIGAFSSVESKGGPTPTE